MPDTQNCPPRPVTSTSPVDVMVGVLFGTLTFPRAIVQRTANLSVVQAARGAMASVEPALALAAHPLRVPQRFHAGDWVAAVGAKGLRERRAVVGVLDAALDELVPTVIGEVLRRGHVADLVIRYVDLDEVVDSVDLDRAIARVDINRLALGLDLNAVAGALDVDAVAARLDVEAVVDRLDLTAIVLEHVDLEALVNVVLSRIDMIAVAQEIIEGIGLTEIIRESTGAMASDTVRGARMRGIAADEAIARLLNRFRTDRAQDPMHGPPGGGGRGDDSRAGVFNSAVTANGSPPVRSTGQSPAELPPHNAPPS